jgi:hypothetical protein
MLPDDEVRALAVTAVNYLIAQAKSGEIDANHELAELVAGAIRDTKPRHLDTLKFLLDQHDPEKTVPMVISPDVLRPR